VEAQAEAERNR
jgi:hypothetical protein